MRVNFSRFEKSTASALFCAQESCAALFLNRPGKRGDLGGELVKGPFGGLLAVICLIGAAFCFNKFRVDGSTPFVIGGIVLALLMVVFGVMFLSGRVNKTEEIHITE